MFGVGPLEIVVIVLFALIFVGPKRLPEVARQFGRFFVQMRRMTSDVRNTIDDAIREAEHDLMLEDRKKLQALLEDQQKRAEKAAEELLLEAGSEASTEDPSARAVSSSDTSEASNPKWDT